MSCFTLTWTCLSNFFTRTRIENKIHLDVVKQIELKTNKVQVGLNHDEKQNPSVKASSRKILKKIINISQKTKFGQKTFIKCSNQIWRETIMNFFFCNSTKHRNQ